MKTIKQGLSILLLLALLVNIAAPTLAAENDGSLLSMTLSGETAVVGDAVSLTVAVERAFYACGVGMTITYDPAVLEPVMAESAALAPFAVHGPVQVGGKTALRVSFLPAETPVALSAGEILSVLRFRTLKPVEETALSMTAAYVYDDRLEEVPLTRPEDAALSVEPAEIAVPVTGIALEKTELTLEEGELETLPARITPADASDPAVGWTSSDEAVAVVSGGVVKALSEGTATITATTRDGGFTAQCTVTVLAPDAGYTVSLPADTTAAVGDVVRVPVVIGSTDGQTGYNAFDLTFDYDSGALELLTTQLTGMAVTVKDGTVSVLAYGEDRPVGTAAFTLEFRVLRQETTHIRVTSARVDNSGNAVVKNAALAALLRGTMEISAAGYPVTLPEGFTGPSHAAPDTDYTFRIPNDYYDYTVTATVNGTEVPLTDNGDGSYTIPARLITGEIVITATGTGKVFRVTLGTDMTGLSTARHGEDYTATLHRNSHYRYSVAVYIGGREYTGYAVFGGSYTIPGVDIVGDVVFRVTKTLIYTPPAPEPDEPDEPDDPEPDDPKPDDPKPDDPDPAPDSVITRTVTFSGTGAGAAQGNDVTVTDDGTYVLTLKQEAGYDYHVSYVAPDGQVVELLPNADGTYTIDGVSSDLEIRIERELNLDISVEPYLTLDGRNAYLIRVDIELEEGKAITYDGHAMYYSEAYGAWTWVIIAEQKPDPLELEQLLDITAQADRVTRYSGYDTDQNGQVDQADVQLILDLYNAAYTGFDEATMLDYLHADANGDGVVDIRDAAAVVWAMENKEDAQ